MKVDESIIWDVIMHNLNISPEEAAKLAKEIKRNACYFIYERENSELADDCYYNEVAKLTTR